MAESPTRAVSELLLKWRAGDQAALQTLVPLVYKELHALAHRYLRNERPGHTLQTTALVHEAYLRLMDQPPFDAQSRTHFVGIAARIMRQILVDYARHYRAAKRGADRKIALDSAVMLPFVKDTGLIALDDALKSLAEIDEQQSRIVELRFFGGLSNEETAEVLHISASTVKREWNVAKAWLSRQMKRDSHGETGAMAKD